MNDDYGRVINILGRVFDDLDALRARAEKAEAQLAAIHALFKDSPAAPNEMGSIPSALPLPKSELAGDVSSEKQPSNEGGDAVPTGGGKAAPPVEPVTRKAKKLSRGGTRCSDDGKVERHDANDPTCTRIQRRAHP